MINPLATATCLRPCTWSTQGKVQSMAYETPLYFPSLCGPRYSYDLAARLVRWPHLMTVPSSSANAMQCRSQRTSNYLVYYASPKPYCTLFGLAVPLLILCKEILEPLYPSSLHNNACTTPPLTLIYCPSLVYLPVTSQGTPETPSLRVQERMRDPAAAVSPLSALSRYISTCLLACAAPVLRSLRTETRGCSLRNRLRMAQNLADCRHLVNNYQVNYK